jgi:hypothetical protein
MSYNEDQQKVGALKHIFIPQPTGLIYELSLAGLMLGLMSLSFIGKSLQASSPESDPIAYATDIINQGWIFINQYNSVQQTMIFLMWAVFGMAVYILLFKIYRLIYGTIHHLRKGVEYVHHDHAKGMVTWLRSLHDISLRLLIWILGSLAIFLGVVGCFSYALGQLEVAIYDGLPDGLIYFTTGYLGTFVGLRLVMIGLCFLLPSFRRWYTV